MLDIPSILLSKLQQSMQTIDSVADPKMTIIAQKAAKYLNQGSFLFARTVRTENSLGPLDICIRREDYLADPTEIIMAYIENGQAKVATLPYVHTPDQNFAYQYTIGPASDVACDFDGRFEPIFDRTGIYFDTETIWALQTFGEPYVALINAGVLTLYQNNVAITPSLVSENAVKCSLIRGFKSRYMLIDNDQGMVCVYTKTDGKVYYRNYCQQIDETYMWELEREITEFVGTVDNISTFLCADYRLGLLAEIAGEMQLLVTERDWSGMAILPEHISLADVTVVTELIAVEYSDYQDGDENISLDIAVDSWNMATYSPTLLRAWNIATSMEDPENPGTYYDDFGYRIVFEFDECIKNAIDFPADFKIVDAYNVTWYGQSVEQEYHSRFVTVTFTDFNNAGNSVTASGLAGNLWNGLTMLEETSVEFDVTGLVPTFVPSPVPTGISNILGYDDGEGT